MNGHPASQRGNHQVATAHVRDCAKALAVGHARVDALMTAIAVAKGRGATAEALVRAVAEGGLRATRGGPPVPAGHTPFQAYGPGMINEKAGRTLLR